MVNRRSNKGTIIDMDAIMAANEKSVAVGNMGVNAKGETVQDGVVVQSSEDRVRAYYKNNPKSSTAQASIKGQRPTLTPDANEQQPVMDVKTAKTAAENLRTMQEPSVSDTVDEVIADKENLSSSDIPPEVDEPEEFDAPEGATPLGFKEVELPNGDIDMVPYYREEDK
jgi:FtsZ-interacting cell division protein ZipA